MDSLAEWSKAPDLGSGPKGRGFKSHSCQVLSIFFPFTTFVFLVFLHTSSPVEQMIKTDKVLVPHTIC